MTVSNHATGNPNARAANSSPEALGHAGRVAPAPPGQLPYMYGRCGQTKRNGQICVTKNLSGHDTCVAHIPRKRDDTD